MLPSPLLWLLLGLVVRLCTCLVFFCLFASLVEHAALLCLSTLPCPNSGRNAKTLDAVHEHRCLGWFCLFALGTEWKGADTAFLWPTKVTQDSSAHKNSFAVPLLLTKSFSPDGAALFRLTWIHLFPLVSLVCPLSVYCTWAAASIGEGSCPAAATDETVLQFSSPVHSGVLPVGQPGAPASTTRLRAWFVSWRKNVVILQLAYSVGERHYGLGLATIFFCAYCNAL